MMPAGIFLLIYYYLQNLNFVVLSKPNMLFLQCSLNYIFNLRTSWYLILTKYQNSMKYQEWQNGEDIIKKRIEKRTLEFLIAELGLS